MKHFGYAFVVFCLFLFVQGAVAQDRDFGLGVIIGEPTGISAKLWTSPINALDFGLGWSYGGDRIGNYEGTYNGGDRYSFPHGLSLAFI